jgi:hypothetical protein
MKNTFGIPIPKFFNQCFRGIVITAESVSSDAETPINVMHTSGNPHSLLKHTLSITKPLISFFSSHQSHTNFILRLKISFLISNSTFFIERTPSLRVYLLENLLAHGNPFHPYHDEITSDNVFVPLS